MTSCASVTRDLVDCSGASSGIVTRSRSFRGASGLAAAVVTPSKLATSTSVTIGATPHRDSLSQLSELLNHGERQGLFGGRMPARVQQAVRDENLRFMRSRDVYCPEYYQFIFELCQVERHWFSRRSVCVRVCDRRVCCRPTYRPVRTTSRRWPTRSAPRRR